MFAARSVSRALAPSSFAARAFASKTLISNISPKLVAAQYAVRGELVIKALEIQKQLAASKAHGLPFDEVVFCNIGNPQELGQLPVSFFRQVLALCVCPDLLNNAAALKGFSADAIARAKTYLKAIPGGTGAYSNSQGVQCVREEVAAFLAARDGHPADPEQIFLTDGASSGVKMGLATLIRDENDGILTPVPQYPLYSATITLQGGALVPYLLDEPKGFATTGANLRASLAAARRANPKLNARAVVVINPGNPTGSIMTEADMRDVVMFCKEEGLLLMADEVYQTNTWQAKQRPFISFKKVLRDLGKAAEGTELISFHSVSKGFVGECGRRGGFFEMVNIDSEVAAQIYKSASISLCSNVEGQLMVGLMCNPPKAGDASYAQYVAERDGMLSSLQRRAQKLATAMAQLPGVSCPPIDGALYLFPQIALPPEAVAAAAALKEQPDVMYCLECLAATGIVIVPGSGFGQAPGTHHFRTTILPSEAKLDGVMERFKAFHLAFMKKYA